MQSLDNAQDVMVCRNCLGFAGDVTSQVGLSAFTRVTALQHVLDTGIKGDAVITEVYHIGIMALIYPYLVPLSPFSPLSNHVFSWNSRQEFLDTSVWNATNVDARPKNRWVSSRGVIFLRLPVL